jgi:Flp pilus assembly protein CpaB
LRASTLFAVTVALLLGLATAIAAKMSGFFNRPKETTPPAKPEIMVLAAEHNLFENFVLQASDVKVRALRPEEIPHYEQHKDQYPAPVVQSAALRVLKKTVEADQPILKEHLQSLTFAEPLNSRLLPSMRAVNVEITKDRSAGGMIQVGDWVDVHLTSRIGSNDDKDQATHTGNIARFVRVVAKRNVLWPVLAPLPDDKPVNFTLEANPYRAALIEFVKDKGHLTLVPVSSTDTRRLEAKHKEALQTGSKGTIVAFSDPDSEEYKEEDARVEAFNKGDLSVGQADLVRIFNLKTTPPPLAPTTVQMFSGIEHVSNVSFIPGGGRTEEVVRGARASTSNATPKSKGAPTWEFGVPGESKSKCKNCGKKKAQ